ncbi:adenylyl-sulfate kinase [Vibrio variabilis]|uniref:adenylyl-sulfate kinase n=1 Tax=Vibrio variabilis TaxID=990271 RepID=UPI000DD7B6DA|nr:adenylyl-sulfate kinase [Vibrio variabilis]
MTSPYIEKDTQSEKSSDVVWHLASVSHNERVSQLGQKPAILWFTGLSGSGKSTIANAVDKMLFDLGIKTYLLDGDNIRHGLNGDLGFSDNDRVENIRRVSEVAKLFVDAGIIVSTAFISPFTSDRKIARDLVDSSQFIEIFIDTPLDICEARDPKGLYKKARAGEIKHFTGISSAYEEPIAPEIHVKCGEKSIEECAIQIVEYLRENNYIK